MGEKSIIVRRKLDLAHNKEFNSNFPSLTSRSIASRKPQLRNKDDYFDRNIMSLGKIFPKLEYELILKQGWKCLSNQFSF